MAMNNDGWVRRFLVTDPQRHRRGFTVYKVVSIVYPVSSPEALTKVMVWKRYNDFKKLHRELQGRHENLYLNGPFPSFSKPSLFGRFEEEVVEERRQCALKLLEFAAEHVALFTSQVFVKFFESGYSMASIRPNKEPPKALTPFSEESELFVDPNMADAILKPLNDRPRLSSSVNSSSYRIDASWGTEQSTNDDDVSFGSSGSSDDGGRTSGTDSPSTVSSTGRNENTKDLLSIFDPLRQAVAAKLGGSNENNQKLLMASHQNAVETTSNLDDGTCHGAGYIFEAACQVSQAQQHEANGQFEGAFESYKLGIGILLNGVQSDADSVRRQVVKEKTAKYLVKAEKIYKTHLLSKEDRAKHLAKAMANLLRPVVELQSYKVLGVVGKNMLVRDASLTDGAFFIKTFWKSPCPSTKSDFIIPHEVPFFVQCLKCYETETAMFTVLECASGKLWDQLGSTNLNVNHQSFLLSCRGTVKSSQEQPHQNPLSPLSPDNSEGLPPMAQDLSELDEQNCNTLESSGAKLPWLDIETSSLVQNAQKLLQSVSATLHRTEKVVAEESTARSEKPTSVQYFQIQQPDAKETQLEGERSREKMRRSSSRSRSTTAHKPGRVIERRYSYDDVLDGRSSLDAGIRRNSKPVEFAIKQRLSEDQVRIYAAQMVLALEALHDQGLFYSDLNPDSVLLNECGDIMLTFIGRWPSVDWKADYKMCEKMYAAPEVSSIQNVTCVSDWWSVGALIFEMLTGKTLLSCHPGGIHSHTLLNLPDWISAEAKSVLIELLKADQFERLGCGSQGNEKLKQHSFFRDVDWNGLLDHGMRKFGRSH